MKSLILYFSVLSLFVASISSSCKKKKITADNTEETPSKPDTTKPTPPSENSTSLIYIASTGRLAYKMYANEGETEKINKIPDFSNAGYKGGGVAIPEIPVKKTISPVPGDNRARIQSAIDEIEVLPADANGFRGTLLLTAGTYEIDGTLFIKQSGVVLRGEGQGTNGTILKAIKKAQHNLLEINGAGSGLGEVAGTRKRIASAYVPTGATSFDLESAAGFAPGDAIAVYRVPNEAWITLLDMAQYGWKASDYDITFERKIKAVSGKTITIDAPIVDPIQNKYGGGYIYKTNITGRINNSGIENLRLVSYYANNDDEDHGWNGIELNRAENCWVKKVTAQYFGYSCVSISSQSAYNTIEECAMIDPKSQTTGGRKYSFNLEGSASFNLFQRCYARGGRHDFVTGSRVPGPNVFLDCYATQTHADIGPHHRWATGLLFDNIYGGQIRVQNRGASGSGHGWSGAQTMFWNCKSSTSDFMVNSPKGAKNWGIGCIGLKKAGSGYWESWGTNVTPRSLYLTQLSERLGSAAINNVTTPAQRTGNIYEYLQTWAGEGVLNSQ